MKAFRRVRKLGARGFTLIELLVVVLIIGILAAIAVPQYFKVVEHGKSAEAQQFIGTLQGAQESYLAQNGVYASALTLLPVGLPQSLGFYGVALAAGANGNNPTWGATLTRGGGTVGTTTPAFYGGYQIIWSGPPGTFVCSGGANSTACQSDLMPQ